MFQTGKDNVNFKHGLKKHRLFAVWNDMKQRCFNPNCYAHKDYGGRGISVADEWKDDFLCFYKWAMNNGYRQGLTIDRIDNSKGYSPDNCRWATIKEQSNNRRSNRNITYKGQTRTLAQWSEELGMNFFTLRDRLDSGWSIEKAFTQPVMRKRNKED